MLISLVGCVEFSGDEGYDSNEWNTLTYRPL